MMRCIIGFGVRLFPVGSQQQSHRYIHWRHFFLVCLVGSFFREHYYGSAQWLVRKKEEDLSNFLSFFPFYILCKKYCILRVTSSRKKRREVGIRMSRQWELATIARRHDTTPKNNIRIAREGALEKRTKFRIHAWSLLALALASKHA